MTLIGRPHDFYHERGIFAQKRLDYLFKMTREGKRYETEPLG
jgi:hypothetical protein